ncbi:MAG: hypothetical protein FJX47_19100, partial [Alphaproteobacteria bacterium]|nr:hypothetical protein [Alphaproteobacteria bacterium]
MIWGLENLLPPLNFDVAAILQFSEEWLRGRRLYVDLVDVNPPLIFAIQALPVLAAWALGVTTPTGMVLFTYALAGLSLALVLDLLKRVAAGDAVTRALLAAVLLFVFLVLPMEGFAQREHLMVILVAPYALLAAARIRRIAIGEGRVYGIALLAAIGFCIKPHFIAIPVLIELYALMTLGWRAWFRDPVPQVMLVFGVIYLVWAVIFVPAYFTEALPVVLANYTKIGDGTIWGLICSRGVVGILGALIVFGAFAFLVQPLELLKVPLLFAFGGLIAGIAQTKGWGHHFYPAHAGMALSVAVIIGSSIDRIMPSDPARRIMPMVATVIGVSAMLYVMAAQVSPPLQRYRDFVKSDSYHLLAIVKRYVPFGSILILSPGVEPHFPMINYANVRLAMDYMTMWVLQGAYRECEEDAPLYRDPQEMDEPEKKVFNGVSEDFVAYKPRLVIVDTIPGIPRCHDETFNYLD